MIRVWIVEDDLSYRAALARDLSETYDIQCEAQFSSCESLLEALKAKRKPDVILLDMRLPGLSGLEAISFVQADAPECRIVMLTMSADPNTIFQSLRAGASGYLLKSGNEDIRQCVREAAQGGAPMTPLVARLVLDYFARLGPPSQDYQLSEREGSILHLMVEGLLKKEIADRLHVSYHTVDSYMRRIYKKLRVNNAPAAVATAVRERLC